jgi:hypothetical protein
MALFRGKIDGLRRAQHSGGVVGLLLSLTIVAWISPGLGLAQESGAEPQTSSSLLEQALQSAGARSLTSTGIPGDPLNIAFVGNQEQLLRLMDAAHWNPADPITFRSSLRISVDSVARRPYPDAPVSNLYVNGKKQDLAFEQPAAGNPSRRHHVRFWRLDSTSALGGQLWIGAATYDTRIGLSHVNGHVTHHIAADVDGERDKLLDDMRRAQPLAIAWIDNFQPLREGRNGGGDPFHTDARLVVVTVP